MWFSETLGKASRLKCPIGEFPEIEDQGPVAVDDILSGSRAVGSRVELAQAVATINRPVLRFTPFRTPAAVLQTSFDCPIQSGAIGACLS